MLVAAFLVFVMHLGFAALEAGSTRAKNTVNILFKNVCVLAIGLLTYGLVGFNLMYPGEVFEGAFFGFSGFGLATDAAGVTAAYADGQYTYWTDFLFQAMFAATAATIVSGAVAERVRLSAFLLFSTVYVSTVYPIVGFWHWGSGWLAAAGFHDFAGSTIVHSVGGWAALLAAWWIGPRLGAFEGEGFRGHSAPLAAIGVLLLWFGWYGFNGGSVLSADPAAVSFVAVTTTLAAASGVLVAALGSWAFGGQPDLSLALNGALAGLVAVTAGADVLSPAAAVLVGAVGGALLLGSTHAMARVRIDDPVGAVPVHLVCGIWGTVAVGLLVSEVSLVTQVLGVVAVGGFCVAASSVLLWGLDVSLGMRVGADEESGGLDVHEHGAEAYGIPPFAEQPLAVAAAK
ncbi:MAG: ammonium transporter [Myxococcales bacterium]|nr:ammonium transporter [Myxococcales bacterium]